MNKVFLMGRPTKDPEVRYSQGEQPMAIARYTLAVDRKGEGADFISCVAFGRNGEFAESKKGMSEEDREARDQAAMQGYTGGDGFMNIPEGIDEELPFN